MAYCYSTFLFHYYYSSTHFVRSISQRCLDQTLWNPLGISYALWSCAFKGWFFQNGCCCHGNVQWILTKLGTCLVLKRIWNPIDFQGQWLRSPGQIFRRGDTPHFALPLLYYYIFVFRFTYIYCLFSVFHSIGKDKWY
jgi:hypothetical protein